MRVDLYGEGMFEDPIDYEREVLIHRYIYYVLGTRILSDLEYDCLEDKARTELPYTSIVFDVGSSNIEDYDEDIIVEAEYRLEELRNNE